MAYTECRNLEDHSKRQTKIGGGFEEEAIESHDRRNKKYNRNRPEGNGEIREEAN